MTTRQVQAGAGSGQPQWQQGQPAQHRPVAERRQRRLSYRLLHSTGDVVVGDRAVALARLAGLPGGKLFVLPAGEA